MPLTTLKQTNTPYHLKAVSEYSSPDLQCLAQELARTLKIKDRVFLEGPMGVGKTTFAHMLLNAFKIHQSPEGSPSFALVHEYSFDQGEIAHIDFYRIQAEKEIEEAGLFTYYWEKNFIVISEWISLWPNFMQDVENSGRTWKLHFSFKNEWDSDSLENSIRKIEIIPPSSERPELV